MKRRLTILTLTTLAVVAFIGVVWTAQSPALAEGATQISGVAFFDEAGACKDSEGEGANFALVMTGDLEGCLYTFVETAKSSPSGTYRETGTETFVGSVFGSEEAGTFETTYRFEAKYEDVTDPATEIFGRCQHPIVEGSGTGIFEGVTGILFFKDDVDAGNFPYRGHLRSIDVEENGSGLLIGTSSDPGGPAADERLLGEGETGTGGYRASC
jgi:hypothetical protein